MNSPLITGAAVCAAFLLGGLAVGGPALVITAAIIGFAGGFALHQAGLRPLVVIATLSAAVIGAVIGKTVVDALCLPGTCAPLSWIAAVLMALGALIGVGLVVALATRSFEEHRAAQGGFPDDAASDPEGGPQ